MIDISVELIKKEIRERGATGDELSNILMFYYYSCVDTQASKNRNKSDNLERRPEEYARLLVDQERRVIYAANPEVFPDKCKKIFKNTGNKALRYCDPNLPPPH
jgi:hypothetical protein